MWNLPAPDGFHGFDPLAPVTVRHRHLPHWRQDGATYAVTFRQADALPQSRVRELRLLRRNWEASHPEPRGERDWEEWARCYSRRVEPWLDEGFGSCRFGDRDGTAVLARALTKYHGTRYHTGAFVVMPNHCHLIIRPFPGEDLSRILQGIKGGVAHAIQRRFGSTGERFWLPESYDRILRDEEHLGRTIAYFGRNPAKAGLEAETAWRFWIADDWLEAGWTFEAVSGWE